MQTQNKIGWIAIIIAVALSAALSIVLYIKLQQSKQRLDEAAKIIESLGQAVFTIDTDIQDTLDISTSFRIPCSIPVQVQMMIMVQAPIEMNVPVRKEMQIPYVIKINEIMPMDTIFRYPNGIRADVSDSIPIDSRLKIRFWPGMKIPFRTSGTIPLNQVLNINPGEMRITSEIPIRINLSDSIPVFLDFNLPVSDTITMPLKINAQATITFYSELPVNGRLPIHVKAPVEIDFSKTILKERFDSLAHVLRNVL